MQVCFKVHGEWLTDYIRNLYFTEGFSFLECKDSLLKSLCLNFLNEEEKDDLTKKILFEGFKFIGVNSLDLVEDKEFDIYDYVKASRPKNFKEGKGVTGILTQHGVFYECSYGGHADLIAKINSINDDTTNGALVFHCLSSPNYYDYVAKDNFKIKISNYQKKWYEQNKIYLSENQIKYLNEFLKVDFNF